jgi:hypothetical protein
VSSWPSAYVAPVLPGGDAGPPRLASPDWLSTLGMLAMRSRDRAGPDRQLRWSAWPTWGAPTPPRRRLPRRRPLPPSKSSIRLPSVLAQMLLVPSEREVARCTEKTSRRRREGRAFKVVARCPGQGGRHPPLCAWGQCGVDEAGQGDPGTDRSAGDLGNRSGWRRLRPECAAGRPRDDGGWAELAVRRAPIAGADRLLRRDGARPDRSEIEGTVLAHSRTVRGA